jgi:hypothetical protein
VSPKKRIRADKLCLLEARMLTVLALHTALAGSIVTPGLRIGGIAPIAYEASLRIDPSEE